MRTLESILDTNIYTYDRTVFLNQNLGLLEKVGIAYFDDRVRLSDNELVITTSRVYHSIGEKIREIADAFKELGVDVIRYEYLANKRGEHVFGVQNVQDGLPSIIAHHVILYFSQLRHNQFIETDIFELNDDSCKGNHTLVKCNRLILRPDGPRLPEILNRGFEFKGLDKIIIYCGIFGEISKALENLADCSWNHLRGFVNINNDLINFYNPGDSLFQVDGYASDVFLEINKVKPTYVIFKDRDIQVALVKKGKESVLYNYLGNSPWKHVMIEGKKINEQRYTKLWPVTKDGYRVILLNR